MGNETGMLFGSFNADDGGSGDSHGGSNHGESGGATPGRGGFGHFAGAGSNSAPSGAVSFGGGFGGGFEPSFDSESLLEGLNPHWLTTVDCGWSGFGKDVCADAQDCIPDRCAWGPAKPNFGYYLYQ